MDLRKSCQRELVNDAVHYYTLRTQYLLIILHIGVVIVNNQEASCSLMNLNFLLAHTTHQGNIMIFSFLVFLTSGFLISVFRLHFNQPDNIVLQSQQILYFCLEFQTSTLILLGYTLFLISNTFISTARLKFAKKSKS